MEFVKKLLLGVILIPSICNANLTITINDKNSYRYVQEKGNRTWFIHCITSDPFKPYDEITCSNTKEPFLWQNCLHTDLEGNLIAFNILYYEILPNPNRFADWIIAVKVEETSL